MTTKKFFGLLFFDLLLAFAILNSPFTGSADDVKVCYEGPSCVISGKEFGSFEEIAFKGISLAGKRSLQGIVLKDVLDERGMPSAKLGGREGLKFLCRAAHAMGLAVAVKLPMDPGLGSESALAASEELRNLGVDCIILNPFKKKADWANEKDGYLKLAAALKDKVLIVEEEHPAGADVSWIGSGLPPSGTEFTVPFGDGEIFSRLLSGDCPHFKIKELESPVYTQYVKKSESEREPDPEAAGPVNELGYRWSVIKNLIGRDLVTVVHLTQGAVSYTEYRSAKGYAFIGGAKNSKVEFAPESEIETWEVWITEYGYRVLGWPPKRKISKEKPHRFDLMAKETRVFAKYDFTKKEPGTVVKVYNHAGMGQQITVSAKTEDGKPVPEAKLEINKGIFTTDKAGACKYTVKEGDVGTGIIILCAPEGRNPGGNWVQVGKREIIMEILPYSIGQSGQGNIGVEIVNLNPTPIKIEEFWVYPPKGLDIIRVSDEEFTVGLESSGILSTPISKYALKEPGEISVKAKFKPELESAVIEFFMGDSIWGAMTWIQDPVIVRAKLEPLVPAELYNSLRNSQAIDLKDYYNSDAISYNNEWNDGDFDGSGICYPAESLPVGKGNKPMECSYYDMKFKFPSGDKGRNNSISLKGQVISLPKPENCVYIFVLGASVSGDFQEEAVLKYTDGTDEKAMLGLSDWCGSAKYGEKTAVFTEHRHCRTGNCIPGANIWMQKLGVNKDKKLSVIVLPQKPEMRIFSITYVPYKK